jgi:hypothetical protein
MKSSNRNITATLAFKVIPAALVLVGILCFSLFSNCKKDLSPINNPQKVYSLITNRDITPTLSHGMLYFASFSDANQFTKSLQDKESDLTTLKQAYSQLGIDTTSTDSIPNLTDFPVCLVTERALSFTSARTIEETAINNHLNNGDDVFSIVDNPYWKTILNSDNAVHIGSRIYKYYSNGGIAIILNDDWTLYNTVKSQNFEDLRGAFNLLITSAAQDGWGDYFVFNTDGSIRAEKPIFKVMIGVTSASEGKVQLTNYSLVEPGSAAVSYQWTYSDHTTSTGPNPNRTINPSESITLVTTNGTTSTTQTEAEILACYIPTFNITYLGSGQVRFELPNYNPNNPNYNLLWVFSDGTTSTSNPVVKTFSSNGTATCEMHYKFDNSVACRCTLPVTIKCGDQKSVGDTRIFIAPNGQRWKLDFSIWVNTNEVGCRTKYLRRILGVWIPWNNQAACTDFFGQYKHDPSCGIVETSGSKCLGSGTFPTSVSATHSDPAKCYDFPLMLSMSGQIKVGGHWIGNGTAPDGTTLGPRLILN